MICVEPTTLLLAATALTMAYMMLYISTETPGAIFDKVFK